MSSTTTAIARIEALASSRHGQVRFPLPLQSSRVESADGTGSGASFTSMALLPEGDRVCAPHRREPEPRAQSAIHSETSVILACLTDKRLDRPAEGQRKDLMKLKRSVILLSMLVAVGVFFAGLTIARADSGNEAGDDPTPTCSLPGNDQGDHEHQGEESSSQGEDVQGDDQADNVKGTEGDDQLDGNGGDDQLEGQQGDDDICGDQGDDELNGGPGNDVLEGGPGNDVENGQAGNDIVRGDSGNDVLTGGPGRDVVSGGPGNDRINVRGHGRDKVKCGRGHDVVIASSNDRVASDCEVVKD